MIENLFINYTKKDNQEMASLVLKNHNGKVKLVCFPKRWTTLKNKKDKKDQFFLKDRKTGEGQTVVCTFNLFKRGENVSYQITNIEHLAAAELLRHPYQYQNKDREPNTPQSSNKEDTNKDNTNKNNNKITNNPAEPLPPPPKAAVKKDTTNLHLAILLNSFLSSRETKSLIEKLSPHAIKSDTVEANSNHYSVCFYLKQSQTNPLANKIQKIDLPLPIKLNIPDKKFLNELLELSFISQIQFLPIC